MIIEHRTYLDNSEEETAQTTEATTETTETTTQTTEETRKEVTLKEKIQMYEYFAEITEKRIKNLLITVIPLEECLNILEPVIDVRVLPIIGDLHNILNETNAKIEKFKANLKDYRAQITRLNKQPTEATAETTEATAETTEATAETTEATAETTEATAETTETQTTEATAQTTEATAQTTGATPSTEATAETKAILNSCYGMCVTAPPPTETTGQTTEATAQTTETTQPTEETTEATTHYRTGQVILSEAFKVKGGNIRMIVGRRSNGKERAAKSTPPPPIISTGKEVTGVTIREHRQYNNGIEKIIVHKGFYNFDELIAWYQSNDPSFLCTYKGILFGCDDVDYYASSFIYESEYL